MNMKQLEKYFQAVSQKIFSDFLIDRESIRYSSKYPGYSALFLRLRAVQ